MFLGKNVCDKFFDKGRCLNAVVHLLLCLRRTVSFHSNYCIVQLFHCYIHSTVRDICVTNCLLSYL